ncbi:MAG: hypothetical protein A2912_06225 [Candidatus Buchananbacteria bacterium RIFCSPLOWO2_01_FULL_40_23b]|uniref:Uncharacterized protein n=1 Tax=Candidatus Buchananbacteria bacterium RIFCSPLOWO2_01_FULL_40_23b TaxID=1797544 RepID=A0A1G1YTS3_9BACT|nr:MAG: hypothetical protein A2912_06225 [Candidatus Buchananbacteria bacterium RIFCSPLOWO2_01_FULL_40_23b]
MSKQELDPKVILQLLENVWNKYPHQRLGQLLENFVFIKGGDKMFYQSDEKTIKQLKNEVK